MTRRTNMNTIVIQLERHPEYSDDPPERACMVLAGDGTTIGVAGPVAIPRAACTDWEQIYRSCPTPILCQELREALAAIGHLHGDYVLGPTIRVESETMDGLDRVRKEALEKGPRASQADYIAIQLNYPGEDGEMPPHRASMLLGRDGAVAGLAGPVSYGLFGGNWSERALANRLEKATVEIGCDGSRLVGPMVEVSMETMEMLAHNWGRGSRKAILRAAHTERKHGEVPLSVEATEARFDRAGDRELAAALWYLWRVGSPLVKTHREPSERYPGGEVCPIGSFVLCVDEEGFVTAAEFPTTGAALGHMMGLASSKWFADAR
jgi:hypothetical protein